MNVLLSTPGNGGNPRVPAAAEPAPIRPARPGPGCPAQHGKGVDLSKAGFTFVADDCEAGTDGEDAITEIFGFFTEPGEDHDDDVLETACLAVPAGSPIAQRAHRVAGDPSGTLTRRAGDLLRGNVAGCPCATTTECPALNKTSLLHAIRHALGER